MNHPRTKVIKLETARLPGARTSIRQRIILLGGMLTMGVSVGLVYWPATHGPFIFDDISAIVNNPSIEHLWPLFGNGNNPGPLNPPPGTPVSARPLVNLSLAVNYHFGGLDPYGYRVVHIFVHLLSAILLWAIIAKTLRLDHFQGRFDCNTQLLPFAAALIWALHPVNTECIVYITQRTELMMGMFYLTTLICSIQYWSSIRPTSRATYLFLATLACCSGMLCKEMMVSAPVIVLLYERTFITGSLRRALRRSWPLYVGLVLAWVPMIAIYYHGSRTPGSGFSMGFAAHEWWFTQSKVIFLFLKLTIWPWPLVIHYEFPILKSVADAWPWLFATGGLAVGTLWLLWRRSTVGFVAICFFAVLSPTLLIPLPGEMAVERRMYVPLAALVPLFIVGGYLMLQLSWRFIERLFESATRQSSRRVPDMVFTTATIALAIGFGLLSSQRLVAYRDELALWQDAFLHQPKNTTVLINLGTQLANADQLPKAVKLFDEAVRLAPDSFPTHYNLAHAFEISARPKEAIEHYRIALKLRPHNVESHYNLARLLEDAGYTHRARLHYHQAIETMPDFSEAHSNLGILLIDIGHPQEAIREFEEALRLLEDLDNYRNLIIAYSLANRKVDATRLVEKASALFRSEGDTQAADNIEAILVKLHAPSQ